METGNYHSYTKSIVLHLLPGILSGIIYYALAPVVIRMGYPGIMALCLAGLIVLIPWVLIFLLAAKKKENKDKLKDLLPYRKKLKFTEYLVWTLTIILLSGLAFKAFGFTGNYLLKFSGILHPERITDIGLSENYQVSKLVTTYIIFFILIVIVLPILEELYFRGYLLPRMPTSLKGFAVPVHSALFALYHTWTPWLIVTRTIAVIPLAYIVKRKENIYIGIIAHCFINSIDFFIGLAFIIKLATG